MSESVRSDVGLSGSSINVIRCWSDTRNPTNSEPTLPSSRHDRVEDPERVTGPDVTAVVMVVALAFTAIGLSASGVIYLVNELLSYSSIDVLDYVIGMR